MPIVSPQDGATAFLVGKKCGGKNALTFPRRRGKAGTDCRTRCCYRHWKVWLEDCKHGRHFRMDKEQRTAMEGIRDFCSHAPAASNLVLAMYVDVTSHTNRKPQAVAPSLWQSDANKKKSKQLFNHDGQTEAQSNNKFILKGHTYSQCFAMGSFLKVCLKLSLSAPADYG